MIVLIVSLAVVGGLGSLVGFYFAHKEHQAKQPGPKQMPLPRMDQPRDSQGRAIAVR